LVKESRDAMKKPRLLLVSAVLLLAAPFLAQAGGGGGIEYITNIGPDAWGFSGLPSFVLASPQTGTIIGVSGFGYGTTRGGWKIGGFGTFFATGPFDFPVPEYGMNYTSALGGFGGVISGGYGRLGPFALSLNLRLGAGGFAVSGVSTRGPEPMPLMSASGAVFGALDLEAGVVLVPAMMVSVYAGASGFLSFPFAIIPAAAPTMGVRLTWGRF
jgi:hypothetical protein